MFAVTAFFKADASVSATLLPVLFAVKEICSILLAAHVSRYFLFILHVALTIASLQMENVEEMDFITHQRIRSVVMVVGYLVVETLAVAETIASLQMANVVPIYFISHQSISYAALAVGYLVSVTVGFLIKVFLSLYICNCVFIEKPVNF